MSRLMSVAITEQADDVVREGVPLSTFDTVPTAMTSLAGKWVAWFCREMGVDPNDEVTRIEWRYLDGDGT